MITTQDYIDKLGIQPSECSCKRCQSMCRSPCCGSVEDFEKLIDAGYADRLMFDDLPSVCDGGDFLKPALKGYEGKQAPWATGSELGCTFWDCGKCKLHKSGLKPIQGKMAIHSNDHVAHENADALAVISKADWESPRGKALIAKWKEMVKYKENEQEEPPSLVEMLQELKVKCLSAKKAIEKLMKEGDMHE